MTDNDRLLHEVARLCADTLWSTAIAARLTCGEAMLFVNVMEAGGRSEAEIARFLWEHSASDDDEQDEHHDMWLVRQRRTA